MDQHLPTVRLTKRQRKTLLKLWINTGIVKAISKRDFFFHKFVQEKNPEIKAQFHTLFKTYQNSIVTLCRKSKSYYFTNYFNQNSTNLHKIWAGVRNIISLKSKKSHNPISISVDTIIVANNFIDFFSSIADKVRSEIPDTNYYPHFSNFLKSRNINSIFLSPTNWGSFKGCWLFFWNKISRSS